MKISIQKFYCISVFYLTFLSIYLLNNNREDVNNLLILNTILSLVTFIFIITSLGYFIKAPGVVKSYTDLLLFVLVFLATFITYLFRGVVVVHGVYLLVFYIIMNISHCQISQRAMKLVCFIGFISLVTQFCLFDLDGRHVLSYIDPNYSSMVVFLFGTFCFYKYSKLFSFFIFSLGLFTLSRNYILVVLFFILTHVLIEKSSCFRKICRFVTKPSVSTAIIVLAPILVSVYIANNYLLSDVTTNTVNSKMAGDIIDSSNVHRALAIVYFLNDFFSNFWMYSVGVDSVKYTKEIFVNTPHHSIFQLILNYGWFFSIPYIYIFFKLVHVFCVKNYKYFPFLISFFLYLMILGGGIYGMYLIWVAFIFKLQVKE